ncbi:MAG TPA: tRNA 2-thiocytidine biosynthesis protein TtcA, partial [Candidatus Atribacteria bacterium]|nr:tRNA 2-thiocytidine biosynthesis protein TtcA [Candidatus Atribacteria bacterium]
ELIRPMYYIREEDIKRFTVNAGINAMNCGCVVAAKRTSSKRREMKELIRELKKLHPDIDSAIFKASENINLDAVLGWKSRRVRHSYLEYYDNSDADIEE